MTPYQVLGIAKDSTAKEIKTAYLRTSSEHHPDKGGDAEKFKQVKDAYEVLSDEARRAEYDATGSTDKPGDINQQAIQVIAKTFTLLLTSHNVSSNVDYISELKTSFKVTLEKYNSEKLKVKNHQQKCEKLLAGTEGEIMRGVIEHQISTCKQQMQGIEGFIAAAKQAQILIKDCKCGADINDVMARRSERQLLFDSLCR